MRSLLVVLASPIVVGLFLAACSGSEDSDDESADGGAGGVTLPQPMSGGADAGGEPSGSGGTSSGGATPGDGGTSGSGGAAPAAGGAGNLPVGALCVADEHCSQSGGAAVCCAIPGCESPCECRLEADCDEGGLFLECNGAADCERFGGSRVCCDAGSMRYCTKQSGCTGTPLP